MPRLMRPVGGILVREWLPGLPLDLRAGRTSAKPWVVVAEVASAIQPATWAFEEAHGGGGGDALHRFRGLAKRVIRDESPWIFESDG